MTDMIERAGRAALCGWNNVPRDNATMAAEWERMGPATREAWMRAMRAAIEAMREPTEAMLDAAEAADTHGNNYSYNSDNSDYVTYADPVYHWYAMIDTALNPSDGTKSLDDGATDPIA